MRELPQDRRRQSSDISWVRPESKSRVIVIEQMRELMQTIHLKPSVARYNSESSRRRTG